MKINRMFLAGLLCWWGFAAFPAIGAEASAAPAVQGTKYTEKGADTCLTCHNEGWPVPIYPIFKTKHAVRADPRTPFAPGGLQCEACHGPGAAHASTGNKKLIGTFGAKSKRPAAEQNKPCLVCHRGGQRTAWYGSAHESNNVACADCHKIHVAHDPVLARATQADVCFTCHRKQRAAFHKSSVHPVRFGLITCSDCHNPHGSDAPAMLVKPTVNQTCYTCHAEKRGPFLWEHAPVAEDCTLCHTPHGSVYQSLLKKNPPLLCQQCHSVANGHANLPYTSASLPNGSSGPSRFLLAASCLNCHSQIHGSNNPSGVKLMR